MIIQVKQQVFPNEGSPTGAQTNSRVSTDPVKIFFDLAFCLCVCPFRLSLKAGSYISSTSLPQQILCLVLGILCMLDRCATVRIQLTRNHATDASQLIQTLGNFTGIIEITAMHISFWFLRDTYVKIINAMQLAPEYLKFKVRKTVCAMYTTCVIGLVLSHIVSGTAPKLVGIFSDPYGWIRCSAGKGRYKYLLGNRPNCSIPGYGMEPPTALELALCFAHSLGEFSTTLMFAMCSTYTFVHIWSMRNMVTNRTRCWTQRIRLELSRSVSPKPGEMNLAKLDWHKVVRDLHEASGLADLFNTAISHQMAMNIAGGTFYFPLQISKIFLPDGIRYAAYVLLDLVKFLVKLVMAADIKANIKRYRVKITTEAYMEGVTRDNFTSEMISITANNIAVKFTQQYDLDFAFLGPFFGFLATLYVICAGHVAVDQH